MYLTGSVTQLLFHEMFKRRLDQILLSNFGVKMLIVEMYVWGHLVFLPLLDIVCI